MSERYKNRLSDPFFDRIDLHVTMQKVSVSDTADTSSELMHEQVLKAIEFAHKRGQNCYNGKLDDTQIERFCTMNDEALKVLQDATQRFSLSFRAIKKVLKVARTIADLTEHEVIEKKDILEALSYRRR